VYLAREVQLHRLVAIKVLHSERTSNADERARLLREARTLGELAALDPVTLIAVRLGIHALESTKTLATPDR
jgi:hypothetical protein